MVLIFKKLNVVLQTLNKCIKDQVFCNDIMPKRSFQAPPKKKIKLQESAKTSKNCLHLSQEYNFSSRIMENQKTNCPETANSKSSVKVEYLEAPVKSENDKKEYRVIKLENGLTALLIADLHSAESGCQENQSETDATSIGSTKDEIDEEDDIDEEDETDEDDNSEDGEDETDEEDDLDEAVSGERTSKHSFKREEKMAACGLCVGVGSFSDPPEIPGLAHFLEHMVFMGSEKYPQENDFDSFITKRGGSDNASTECENTTFYFEIQEKFFLAALDRFAQFFIKPLMKRNAITREREAVESEFQMALPSDFFRKEQLFSSFAQPDHPASKFIWGNIITLRDNVEEDKLYEELHKFRERHYSAHRMKLTVQARLPLDTLQEYVTQCFADIPSNQLPPDDFSKFKASFDTPNFRKIYKIKPVKDVCQVELTWAMPTLLHLYKSKPHQYVSWIIGHEGKGSLISYLRKKMWCLDIYSGNAESGFEHNSMYALFSLSLILTDEGHKHLEEVLNAVFSFLNLMRKEGPQKRIYDEISQIEEINFRFTDEVPPVENVEDICENMQFYPPNDYLTGNDLYFEYNPEAIQDCLNQLRADNANIIIFDKKFNDDEFEKIEPWFQTKYTDVDINKEWIENWKTIEPLPEFHLPEPNIFITDNFDLIPKLSDTPKYPVKILEDSRTEVWYRPDTKFGLPECYIYLYIVSPLAVVSAQNAAMLDLFVTMLKQLLVEELYPATAAELNYQVYSSDKGMIIAVNGFNQKLPLLLTTITRYIANFPNLDTKDLFSVMKREQLKSYYNTFLKPSKLVKDVRLSILMLRHYPAVDKHTALSNVDFEQFQNFIQHFNDHVFVQCLVQGNITQEDAIKNVENCLDILKCGSLLPNTAPQMKVNEIPLGTHYCKVKNFNKADMNSVVTNYYQFGVGSIKLSVMIELLMMMMEEPLFNQLRTLEQLGYNVFCLLRDTFGILGYSITVCTQANKYATEHIDDRIEEFLKSFNKKLEETTEKELKSVKEALIKVKSCADIHLKEEVNRNWAEITKCEYMFDRLEEEIEAIKNIEIKELKDWINNHTIDIKNLRKLSVHIIGTASNGKENMKNQVHSSKKNTDDEKHVGAINSEMKCSLEFVTDKTIGTEDKSILISDIESHKRNFNVYPVNAKCKQQ